MNVGQILLLVAFALSDFVSAADFASVREKTVMVVQAHPDDAESRCAGTVALLKKNGNKIVYVICSNDDKGTYDPKATIWVKVKNPHYSQARDRWELFERRAAAR